MQCRRNRSCNTEYVAGPRQGQETNELAYAWIYSFGLGCAGFSYRRWAPLSVKRFCSWNGKRKTGPAHGGSPSCREKHSGHEKRRGDTRRHETKRVESSVVGTEGQDRLRTHTAGFLSRTGHTHGLALDRWLTGWLGSLSWQRCCAALLPSLSLPSPSLSLSDPPRGARTRTRARQREGNGGRRLASGTEREKKRERGREGEKESRVNLA